MNIIETLENEQLRNDIPEFRPGDTVRVHVKVIEGKTERVQVFEGIVIARRNAGVRETFTVRRISYGVGVERTFLVHSPRLEKIEVKRRGIVRRAKLFYLRGLSGKAARIKERNNGKKLQRCAVFYLPQALRFCIPLFFSLPGCGRIVKVQGGDSVLPFYK